MIKFKYRKTGRENTQSGLHFKNYTALVVAYRYSYPSFPISKHQRLDEKKINKPRSRHRHRHRHHRTKTKSTH